MSMISLPPKITTDVSIVDFDASSQLAVGETISGALVTASVASGDDAAPEDIISGVATVDNAIVSQSITGGVAGVVYLLNCAITTSTGRDIIIQAYLAVLTSIPF